LFFFPLALFGTQQFTLADALRGSFFFVAEFLLLWFVILPILHRIDFGSPPKRKRCFADPQTKSPKPWKKALEKGPPALVSFDLATHKTS
jgi:hypothetical protein